MTDDDIRDLFSDLGTVAIKRMFGGKGIYFDGVIIALELDGEILLKADKVTAPAFEAAGAKQWIYRGHQNRKPTIMPYWTIPESAVDDPDEMAVWARKAYDAGKRTAK
jgi:DNA transformation protein